MTSPHTQGRLHVCSHSDNRLRDVDGRWIADADAQWPLRAEESAANARRLAACWNAFVGVPTSAIDILIEQGGVGPLDAKYMRQNQELAAAIAERDQLRAELGEVLDRSEGVMAENDRLLGDLMRARSHEAAAVALLREVLQQHDEHGEQIRAEGDYPVPNPLAERIGALLGDAP
jgi:hypothetical protein